MRKSSYTYVAMPIKDVMADIDRYVIPENREVIELLWSKNILTKQTNNYYDDFSWVEIGDLSAENHDIFWGLANKNKGKDEKKEPLFTIYGAITVPIVPGTMDPYESFKELIDLLKFQDVQKDGYMTIDEFYIECTDCYKYVENPNASTLEVPKPEEYEDMRDYSNAYDEWVDSVITSRQIKVVDESKIDRPLEEYLKQAGLEGCYDEEEGKIFYNRRLYEGHMRYKNEYSSGSKGI